MKNYNLFLSICASILLVTGVFVLSCDEKLLTASKNAIGILLGVSAMGIYLVSCLNHVKENSYRKLSPKKVVFLYIALWITFIGLIAYLAELFVLGFSIRENYLAYIGIITEVSLLAGILMVLKQHRER
ncbi:MAG: hypothetical protein LBP25_01205 [Tannerellaceae bacterium]|jgi:hypothetical protein|nr:hypothetical protein [Tannerellaceae bacterium]